MQLTNYTILITGGATGIGLALAKAFLAKGNQVIITGRRKEKLQEAKERYPSVHIYPNDVSDAGQRIALYEWVVANFPTLNVLINNAGIQREVDFKAGVKGLPAESEIEINLTAPIHLTALFTPHLMKQPVAAIMNVSSGLGFIPMAIMPVYCATKAALHSFSWSLRHQLRDTPVKVFEIVPPIVDTELDQGARDRRGQTNKGIQPREVADQTMAAMATDTFEIAVGMAQNLMKAARNEQGEMVFGRMNP